MQTRIFTRAPNTSQNVSAQTVKLASINERRGGWETRCDGPVPKWEDSKMAALVFGPRYTCNRHRRFWRRIRFRLIFFQSNGTIEGNGKAQKKRFGCCDFYRGCRCR